MAKTTRRKPHTPTSQIKSALRKLWLRSRERQRAIKRDGYACVKCGKKQSRAKGREVYVEVNHRRGIKWAEIIAFIRAELLCEPSRLETLCKEHHAEITVTERPEGERGE